MRRVGRYEILSELGRGGSGVVYAGRDLIDGRDVAIKEVRGPSAGRRGGVEGEALRRLSHPGVLRVLDTFRERGRTFIVMEKVDGESLQTLLERRGTLDVEQAVALACQAARALAAIHRQGVIHRDIKPANLLLAADGSLKIADFGVALCSGDDSDRGEFLGTPAYVAPERWRGLPADPRSDLYALGVVLFRMLTGRRPHQAASVQELARSMVQIPAPPPSGLRSGLPASLDGICARLLAREPEQRFAGGEEVARSLEEVVLENLECSGGGQPAAAAGPFEQTWQRLPCPGRRRGSRAWLLAALLAAGVLVIVGLRSGSPAAAPARRAGPAVPAPRPTVPAAVELPPEVEVEVTSEPPLWSPARTPSKSALERYAAVDLPQRPVHPRPQPAVVQPEPPDPLPLPDKPAPAPAAARWESMPERSPAVESLPAQAALRGVVEISHGLEEGIVELRIDGRRRALARIGAGAPFGPSAPVLIPYEIAAGSHRFEVRLLSASAGVEAERVWNTSPQAGGFQPKRLRLVSGDGSWELAGP